MSLSTTTKSMAASNIRLTPTGLAVIIMGTLCILLYSIGLPIVQRFTEPWVDMKTLLSVSIDLAQQGGSRVVAVRSAPLLAEDQKVKGLTKEGAKELQTKADLESHRVMFGGFVKAFPKLKIISEEHDDNNIESEYLRTPNKHLDEVAHVANSEVFPTSDITVWIDPLDATQEFSENLTEYVTTMVCVAVKGRPVIGVVHRPFQKETAWAYVDHGMSPDLMTPPENKDVQKVVVSRSHAGDVKKDLESAFGDKLEIIPAGGAGYKVLQVLSGKVTAYVHKTAIKKWDICAGNALLRAVRGRMTTLNSQNIDYSPSGGFKNLDGLLATFGNKEGKLHDLFIKSLAKPKS